MVVLPSCEWIRNAMGVVYMVPLKLIAVGSDSPGVWTLLTAFIPGLTLSCCGIANYFVNSIW